jgi:hypothetical protein
MENERNFNLTFDHIQNTVDVVLLRINRLAAMTSLSLETSAVALIKEKIPHDLQWGILHSFAKRELLLLLSHNDSIKKCEDFVRLLSTAYLGKGSNHKAFDQVVSWPCLKMAAGENPYSVSIKKISPEPLPHVKGVRVSGCCEKESLQRHSCTDNSNIAIYNLVRPKIKEPTPVASGSGPMTPEIRKIAGAYHDRQIGWRSSDPGILNQVQELRKHCEKSCCSIYLVREINNEWNEDFVLLPNSPAILKPKDLPNSAKESLKPIKDLGGSQLMGAHLESIRNKILQGLLNPLISAEFEDLLPMLDRLATISNMHLQAQKDIGEPINELEKFWKWSRCRGYSNFLTTFLGRAVSERIRQDICGQNHHLEFAFLGASGMSRLNTVAHHCVSELLRSFGIEWDGLCVNGVIPSFRSEPWLGLFNAPVQASLKPYWLFGLGHEVGHTIWHAIVLGYPLFGEKLKVRHTLFNEAEQFKFNNEFNARQRKEFVEYFSDVICLNYTFRGKIDKFISSWLEYYVEWLESELLQDFTASLAGEIFTGTISDQNIAPDDPIAQVKFGANARARIYCERLMVIVAYSVISDPKNHSISKIEVAQQSIIILEQFTAQIHAWNLPHHPAHALASTLDGYFKSIQEIKKRGENDESARNEDEKFLFKLANVAKNIQVLINRIPNKPDPGDSEVEKRILSHLRAGEIPEEQDSLLLSLVRSLGKDASYIASVAAILYIVESAEKLLYNKQGR